METDAGAIRLISAQGYEQRSCELDLLRVAVTTPARAVRARGHLGAIEGEEDSMKPGTALQAGDRP